MRRAKKVTVAAFDAKGKKVKFTASGLFARVVQHEIDHTNGILYIDRIEEQLNEKHSS